MTEQVVKAESEPPAPQPCGICGSTRHTDGWHHQPENQPEKPDGWHHSVESGDS